MWREVSSSLDPSVPIAIRDAMTTRVATISIFRHGFIPVLDGLVIGCVAASTVRLVSREAPDIGFSIPDMAVVAVGGQVFSTIGEVKRVVTVIH